MRLLGLKECNWTMAHWLDLHRALWEKGLSLAAMNLGLNGKGVRTNSYT
jgi:hypothetical protein